MGDTIGARFPADILAKIDALIESGDFGSRGEFVQFAVRKTLKSLEDGTLPPRGGGERGLISSPLFFSGLGQHVIDRLLVTADNIRNLLGGQSGPVHV